MAHRPFDPRPRFALVVPGLPQYLWGQRGRGLVFGGWYLSGIAGAVLGWGTWAGPFLVAFAVLVHLVSAVDVLRHSAFPGWGWRVSWAWALGALGLGCYVPALLIALVLAWPAVVDSRPWAGSLVNLWSYQGAEPVVGDRVWVMKQGLVGPGAAVVVALPGDSVERRDDVYSFPTGNSWPLAQTEGRRVALEVRVPTGHLLVAFEERTGGSGEPARLALVARSAVLGRVWASLPIGFLRGAKAPRWDFDPTPWTGGASPI